MGVSQQITIHLDQDFLDFCRAELDRLGYDTSALAGENVGHRYFSVCRRLVTPTPRAVLKASVFSCPPEHQQAANEIERKIRLGEEITSHLSTRIKNVNYDDDLLNHWGIHHLHLGIAMRPDGFVDRTDLLIFCRFSDANAYFLEVLPHQGSWTLQRLVQVIHDNWPAALDEFRAPGVKGNGLTDAQVKRLRDNNINHVVQVSDGTVYLPSGGGASGSGGSPLDVYYTARWLHWARDEQQRIIDDLDDIRERAAKSGHPLPDVAEFRLEVLGDTFCAVETTSRYTLHLIDP